MDRPTTRPSTQPTTRPTDRPTTRPTDRPDDRGDWQDNRGDRQDNRQDRWDDRDDNMDDRREFRQDAYDEHHDHYSYNEWYEDRWKYAVGASLTMAVFSSLTCTTTIVVVSGMTYYNCGPTWYNRAYSGGSVTYVVVGTPAGY
jgi:hypothetical protein